MALPILLILLMVGTGIGDGLQRFTFWGVFNNGVVQLMLLIGAFTWYYPARITRAQMLTLRHQEYVEAARMVGASNWRIVRSHVFPHLLGPLIVLATLNVAAFILAEAGLSFLGLGIQLPTASWGNLLADAPQYYTSRPLLMVWPGVALLLTTLAFNLLGDGLRDAFDPRGSR
jgi:ABC-type dipeptide/oligopeptide/nickel transport system permease subunit